MAIERKVTADDIAKDVHDLIKKATKKRAKFTGPSGPLSEGDGGDGSTGMNNPMTAAGDVIYGGQSGSPRRRAIGNEGDVFTVESGVPVWKPSSGAGSGFQYRQFVVVPDGSDGFLFVDDGAGNPVYTLEDLE